MEKVKWITKFGNNLGGMQALVRRREQLLCIGSSQNHLSPIYFKHITIIRLMESTASVAWGDCVDSTIL